MGNFARELHHLDMKDVKKKRLEKIAAQKLKEKKDREEKKDYVRKLKLFLEKQKLFFFRVSLSDDPEAVQVKEHILDTAQMFGFKEMTGMDKFFQQLDETIKKVEKDLD